MKRALNWDINLIRFAESVIGQQFVWGQTNCTALALRALDAQCEQPVLWQKYRRHMKSASRARAFLRRYPLDKVVAMLEFDGLEIVTDSAPQRGDLLINTSQEWALAASINLGRHVLSSTESAGVIVVPSSMSMPPEYILRVSPCL